LPSNPRTFETDDERKGIKREGEEVTVPLGAELPHGYKDVTGEKDRVLGLRRGVKE
jgi:hypothetical protein